MKTSKQVVYFPYLFMTRYKYLEFDRILVWNFPNLLSEQVEDIELRTQISKLLKSNRRFGKEILDMGVVKVNGTKGYDPLQPHEIKRVNDLRTALFLSTVAQTNIHDGQNAGHMMVTAENFTVIFQNFTVESDSTGYSAGKIVTTTDFGYRIGEIKYEAPRSLAVNALNIDEKLLKAMGSLKRKRPKQYRLILSR